MTAYTPSNIAHQVTRKAAILMYCLQMFHTASKMGSGELPSHHDSDSEAESDATGAFTVFAVLRVLYSVPTR